MNKIEYSKDNLSKSIIKNYNKNILINIILIKVILMKFKTWDIIINKY